MGPSTLFYVPHGSLDEESARVLSGYASKKTGPSALGNKYLDVVVHVMRAVTQGDQSGIFVIAVDSSGRITDKNHVIGLESADQFAVVLMQDHLSGDST